MIFEHIKAAKQLLFDNRKSKAKSNNVQDILDELIGSTVIYGDVANGEVGVNSDNAQLVDITLLGKSIQDSVPSLVEVDLSEPSTIYGNVTNYSYDKATRLIKFSYSGSPSLEFKCDELIGKKFYVSLANATPVIAYTDSTGSTVNLEGAEFDIPTSATNVILKLRMAESTAFIAYSGTISVSTISDIESVAKDGSLVVTSCCKNLINPNIKSQTINGLDITNNNDGTATISGTPTETTYLVISDRKLPNGRYKATGSPSGGTKATYGIISRTYSSSVTTYDTGNGGILELTEDNNDSVVRTIIYVVKGVPLNNAVFKPMIRLAEIEDDTYEQYVGSKANLVIDTLRGIPVSEGGNYTDASGQEWICDTVNLRTGKRIQRVRELLATSSDVNSVSNGIGYINCTPKGKGNLKVLCTHYADVKSSATGWTVGFKDEVNCTDTDTFKAFLDKNDIKICYALLTPIETDLTEEQLTELRKLYSYEEYTTVYTDDIGDVMAKYRKNNSNAKVIGEHCTLEEVNSLLDEYKASVQNMLLNKLDTSRIQVLTVEVPVTGSTTSAASGNAIIDYPEGLNMFNTIVLSAQVIQSGARYYNRIGYIPTVPTSVAMVNPTVALNSSNIAVALRTTDTTDATYTCQVVLLANTLVG